MSNNLSEYNSIDFGLMHDMLNEIELKTLGVDPIRLMQFYKPIFVMLRLAKEDSANPKDSFLYGETHTQDGPVGNKSLS